MRSCIKRSEPAVGVYDIVPSFSLRERSKCFQIPRVTSLCDERERERARTGLVRSTNLAAFAVLADTGPNRTSGADMLGHQQL